MNEYLWLIPALPLLGFVLNGLVAPRFGKGFVKVVGPGVVGLSFALSIAAFCEMLQAPGQSITQHAFTWLESGGLYVPIAFVVDRLSGLYILIVTGVGFLIHIYSVGYMGDDDEYAFWRFFAYLNLFLFFMLLLVLGSSFLLLFVGWEGVGLCSYLLIGYYFDKDSAATAAKKAFVVNRIGDFGFIVATLLIFMNFGTLEFAEVNARAPGVLAAGGGLVTAITLLLFLGATGKSAQIPLYVWLPDAMEGPTPVSALIHAATMVTAGLYLVARMSGLFVLAPTTMAVVAIIGAATAFFAATIGMAQYDIKRVLAYSTVSQLGYMFMAMGVGAFMAGIFHVMTHAFFKALLFLGSGSVIHAMHHEQDMRRMGGLLKHMPITGYTYIIGALAIGGVPLFTAGFFSKDEILWQSFASPAGHPLLWAVGAVTALMTAFYMFRTVALTFFGESRVDKHTAEHLHESPWTMTLPLSVLAVLSIVGGWIGIPHVLGHGVGIGNALEHYFEGFFAKVPAEVAHHEASTELLLMGLTSVLALGCMYGAYVLFSRNLARAEALKKALSPLQKLLEKKYFIDELYEWVVIKPVYYTSKLLLWRLVDVRIIDGMVNGVGNGVRHVGGALRIIHNGVIENYAVGIAVGAALIFYFLVY
ncbi:MAG: NADH-quinone oxidoreductase subunit L [Deltaproteobacteria bacterium]|nr:NADH-quinone oxidoreductase subunit L [Deltaproteobacteria bacterium]